MKNGLFIFRRDYRITDNIGLLNASKQCDRLYTCFIFTPEQVGKSNSYRSQNAIQFMIESLEELSKTIREHGGELLVFYGKNNAILKELVQVLDIEGIFFNKDYTPYAIERDQDVKELCKKLSIECQMSQDYYLYEPDTVLSSNHAYKKYTPFMESVLHKKVEEPIKKIPTNLVSLGSRILSKNLEKISLKEAAEHFTKSNPSILVHGGRSNALLRLKSACREQSKYDVQRNMFTAKTTFLSAYIKFGCVSIREVYHSFKKVYGLGHGLIRELLWREFFVHVLYGYPEVVGKSYQPRYQHLKWHNSAAKLARWQKGETGFPLIDASMRQLNETGYMHNRGRMAVATFLVKTLLIDWRHGEKYFATKLTDYDLASNNGNWQGISSTGVDMKPYFRDMNPWIQGMKFDPDAEFIKKWVPELRDVLAKDIHKWTTMHEDPKYKSIMYPKPMVDYDEQKELMIEMYKHAS
jgi:deoxyribodipyrimidine photo-lyase